MATANETDLTLLSALAVHAVVEELVPRFSREQGIRILINYDVNPAIAERVRAGEMFDVGLNNPWYVDEMVQQGRVYAGLHLPFGRIPLAIGQAGAATEVATSHVSVRGILSEADSIAYTDNGTSGKTFLRAIRMMGLEPQILDRLRPMGAGEPPIAAAQGRVQYAIAPLSRILAAPGVTPIATFPDDLDLNIDMSMFINIGSRRFDTARRLIAFLSDPSHDAYLLANGISRFALKAPRAASATENTSDPSHPERSQSRRLD